MSILHSSPPRVRFAPSPTGYLHVGGARTALFNWLYARHTGGRFLLRIEDTDRERSTDESTRAIFEGLTWLGLAWDEDVVRQSAGLERHRRDAQRLLMSGHAYRCFCTPAEVDAMRAAAEARKENFKYDRRCDRLPSGEPERRAARGEPFVLRFRVPGGRTEWDDVVLGPVSFDNDQIGDFVVLRSDGTPIYNMAVVSDDIEMRITLVMRGQDHVTNTASQILIYRALGAELPRFAHVPNVHGPDGRKLSKRHGATAVGDYQRQGILASAMVNFLALLGWSPGGDREVMTVPELIELFSLEALQKKPAIFDVKKLEWMNGEHITLLSAEQLEPLATPELVAAGLATRQELSARRGGYLRLLDLLKVRARTIGDIVRQAVPYFRERIDYEPDAVAKNWKDRTAAAELLAAARERLAAVARWDAGGLETALRALVDERGVAAGKVFQPLRVALTGASVSPGIFEVLDVMGREMALRRIDDALSFLDGEQSSNSRVDD